MRLFVCYYYIIFAVENGKTKSIVATDAMSVLKNNRNSIYFLTSENEVISWKITGNAAPDRYYRNGMIEHIPFNIEAEDFIGVFGE